jgi:hypothetical protein
LKGVKDQFFIDVQKAVKEVEGLNSGKINSALQAQRDLMREELKRGCKSNGTPTKMS